MDTDNFRFTPEDFQCLQEFVKKEILPHSRARDEQSEFPFETFSRLHELGWLRSFIPTHLGGLGANTEDLAQVLRMIAYGSPGMAFSVTANMTALATIFLYGSETLRNEVAEEYNRHFQLTGFCFTEPDHGSDVLRIETTAREVEGGFRITGKKCFITNANHASRLLIVARHEGFQDPRNSLSLFLVNRDAEGLAVGNPYSMLGLRDSNTGEIFLDNVFVPSTHLVGEPGKGFEMAGHTLQRSRTLLSATAIGLCDRALELAETHVAARELYGRPLLTQAPISNQLAQLHTEREAAWLLIQSAARQWDLGKKSFRISSMAKLLSGQVAVKTASACLELFGGYGCTKEYEIERIYRDAKFCEIVEGPTFVQLAIIAKELFSSRRSSLKKVA